MNHIIKDKIEFVGRHQGNDFKINYKKPLRIIVEYQGDDASENARLARQLVIEIQDWLDHNACVTPTQESSS